LIRSIDYSIRFFHYAFFQNKYSDSNVNSPISLRERYAEDAAERETPESEFMPDGSDKRESLGNRGSCAGNAIVP